MTSENQSRGTPDSVDAAQIPDLLQKALAAHQGGRLTEAEVLYGRVLALQPDQFDALHLSGVLAAQSKQPDKAVELIARAIASNPRNAAAHFNHGAALADLAQFTAAIDAYDRALTLNPGYGEAYTRRGNAQRALHRHEAAIASYAKALELNPENVEALVNRGNSLAALGRTRDAIASYDGAISLRPDDPGARFNRAVVFRLTGQLDSALADLDIALRYQPDFAEAHFTRGVTLVQLRRHRAALASYDRAIQLRPAYADAHNNRGVVLQELGELEAALLSFAAATRHNPELAEAYNNRAIVLGSLKRYAAAGADYDRALALKPAFPFALGMRLHNKMQMCDWIGFDGQVRALAERIERGEHATPPLPVLALLDVPSLQHKAAEIWMGAMHPAPSAADTVVQLSPRSAGARAKLRIGYYSADYYDHPTTTLIAELFERHDRARFELFGFSFGPDKHDGMRRRVSAAFDRFMDVREQSDQAVAAMSRDLGIDVAVDLKGLTVDHRLGIFAHRPAPVRVHYLGYPGTLGTDDIDYLIADPMLIPEGSRQFYREKIVYLPHSYQVNDTRRQISERVFTRADAGLPPAGFVFCCFNNSYKITPATFDGWMRILARVDNSVLWLIEDNATAAANLRQEATLRGIDPNRLVFAGRLPLAEHLARHRLAHLFLDTLPYNAHTTASDALWAGLPVLTCLGDAFAGRVAASLLAAAGLPELIASTQLAYEDLAVELATNPARLRHLKGKLAAQRSTAPLFDPARFARHLEDAYAQMIARHNAGLAPDHITVAP